MTSLAIFKGYFRLDMPGPPFRVKSVHQGLITCGDDAPPHLSGAGQLPVIGVELLEKYQEPADLRRGQSGLGSEIAVHLPDTVLDQFIDRVFCCEFLVGGIGEVAPLCPVSDGPEVDIDE